MADTKRTSTDLLTNLFQDGQGANAISEQDVRDFIASLVMPHGGAYFEDSSAETTINTISVFETIAGTFSALPDLVEISVNASGGILTYTGAPDRHFNILSNINFMAAGNNKIVRMQWFKNGTTALPAHAERKISTGADIGAMSVLASSLMTTGDTLQLKVANETDATNITVEDIRVYCHGEFVQGELMVETSGR